MRWRIFYSRASSERDRCILATCFPVLVTSPEAETADQVWARLTGLKGEALGLALDQMLEADKNEQQRRTTLDTKASILVPALAIASAFTLQAGGLLQSLAPTMQAPVAGVFVFLYLCTLGLLGVALIGAGRALWVRRWWATADPEELLDFRKLAPEVIKQQIVASMLVAWRRNAKENDLRADHLAGGQISFLLATFALMLIGVMLGLLAIGRTP